MAPHTITNKRKTSCQVCVCVIEELRNSIFFLQVNFFIVHMQESHRLGQSSTHSSVESGSSCVVTNKLFSGRNLIWISLWLASAEKEVPRCTINRAATSLAVGDDIEAQCNRSGNKKMNRLHDDRKLLEQIVPVANDVHMSD